MNEKRYIRYKPRVRTESLLERLLYALRPIYPPQEETLMVYLLALILAYIYMRLRGDRWDTALYNEISENHSHNS